MSGVPAPNIDSWSMGGHLILYIPAKNAKITFGRKLVVKLLQNTQKFKFLERLQTFP